MKLELCENDLIEQNRDLPTSAVSFAHFRGSVQEAIIVVGSATFYRHRGTINENFNTVFPPKRTM